MFKHQCEAFGYIQVPDKGLLYQRIIIHNISFNCYFLIHLYYDAITGIGDYKLGLMISNYIPAFQIKFVFDFFSQI